MELSALLKISIEKQASDLHIIPDYPPTIRVNGELHQLSTLPDVSPEDSEMMFFSLLNQEQKENLLSNREIDLSFSFNNYRFRGNIYFANGKLNGSFRLIPAKIKTLQELNLPSFLYRCTEFSQGLVLVTGPTGEGKSTTLTAIINEINMKYAKHIITIEDPIEYVYPKAKSIISQRQLHDDTHSWGIALKSALREDPDVILVGELRDFDTIQLALTAAETGHLVFSTLHTNSTPETIDRIVGVFPPHHQSQIKNQLATVLKIIIAQRLLPMINGLERIPAVEVLVNTPSVAAIIREGKTYLINNILETEEAEGQFLFEKYLLKLYREGKISQQTALSYAIRPKELEKFIK